MILAGAPALLAALVSFTESVDDGSANGSRTLMGAAGVLAIIAVVIGIGVVMSGGSRAAR